MGILASVPTIIEAKRGKIRVCISTLPLTSQNEFLVKLKETFDIDESCKDIPLEICYALLYGGVVISTGSDFERIEINGCVKMVIDKEGKEFSVEEFIKNPYDCFSFDNMKLCFSEKVERDCKTIDNIGLRFIIK